ncbi:anthranilate phosphoribosyltransferase, partial [Klebsiella pneumoniae]|nr:anthranilate phosphoribosyltransferase [Klebsiella pneumoniae]
HDGLDEITITDTTTICEVNDGKVTSYFITPEQFGLERGQLSELIGGDPEENAQIALDILNGEQSARRNIVVMNAAC